MEEQKPVKESQLHPCGPRIVLLRNVHRNLGDEAMLECEIQLLRRRFGGNLIVLTDDPERVAARYGVEAGYSDVVLINPGQGSVGRAAESAAWITPWVARRLRGIRNSVLLPRRCARFLRQVCKTTAHFPGAQEDLVQALRGADVVVSGGSLMPTVPHMELVRMTVFAAIGALGKPLVLSGQSIYRSNATNSPYRDVSRIVTRDAGISRANAESCGVDPERILDGIDPAFCLPQAPEDEVNRLLQDWGLSGRKYAAVNVRSGVGDTTLQKLAARLQKWVAEGRFERVLLFGMQSHSAENDARTLRRLSPMLKGIVAGGPADGPVDQPIVEWNSPGLLKAVIARAEFVAAARYHAVVFALTSGKPALAMSVSPDYDLKLRGILDQFGRGEWLQRTGDPVVDREAEWFDPGVSAQLMERTQELASREGLLADCVQQVLERTLV